MIDLRKIVGVLGSVDLAHADGRWQNWTGTPYERATVLTF